MPREVTKTVYTFRELIAAAEDNETEVSERDVDRARDWLREGATMHDWYEFTYNDWKEALEQVGFTDADISFSGFWSQGDGASFTSGLDIEKLLTFFTVPIEPSQAVLDGEPGGWLPRVVKECGQRINRRYEWLFLALDCFSGRVNRNSHHYSHENTCGVDLEFDYPRIAKELESIVDSFQEDIEDLRKDLCHAIYKELEAEYEYRTGDEQLMEDSDANEYTFDADGRREG